MKVVSKRSPEPWPKFREFLLLLKRGEASLSGMVASGVGAPGATDAGGAAAGGGIGGAGGSGAVYGSTLVAAPSATCSVHCAPSE